MSIQDKIKSKITHGKQGRLYTVAEFNPLGTKSAVYKALGRLTQGGLLERVGRGLYFKPLRRGPHGPQRPSPEDLVAQLAGGAGRVQPQGAELARRLGLSTQMPLRPQFVTRAQQRTLHLGALTIRLRPAAKALHPVLGRPAGEALSALLFLGKAEVTPEVVAKVRAALTQTEYQVLQQHAPHAWLKKRLT